MKGTMCGLVKENAAPGKFVYHTDLPIPQIDDDEVLIKIHCTAVCGTDLHIMDWDKWSQARIKPPLIPGHEMAGDIVEVGKNVHDRKVGNRVSCETHIPCNRCWFCKNGLPHICKDVKLFGVTENGAFAEYAKIRADSTFLLDGDISYETACLFEPMGAGVHGVESAEVAGKTVLVSGCGPIGLTAISASKTFGAKLVIACDLVDERLETAREMGADVVLNSGKCNLADEIHKLTDGIGVDAAIDITGAEPAISASLRCVRAAGRLVCVGLPTKNVTLDLTNDLIYREVEMTGVSGRKIWDTWADFETVMKGPYYKLDKVIGRRFALKEFEKAMDAIQSGVPGKMMLYPGKEPLEV
ncbi:zinc-binding dehydrogenase [uncultured Oscillibacter sp.]|uniref:zinc-binding dehydrogenase n=1 Tax=uncultured Oscillibacter sp. TaxID=876091 RepID=UPI0025E438B4|nr:alcohol dehydrogenase catalytic domain-containing protein [uncultured Oscillibacter sp.]